MSDYDEAKTWISLAERDYTVATHLHTTLIPKPIEIICFHCQQAVEKALKAVLAYYGADIPKTHDITLLIKLCSVHTNAKLTDEKAADTITTFAVVARYVEDNRDFTEDTAKFALKQAQQTLEMVKQYLAKSEKEQKDKDQKEETPK